MKHKLKLNKINIVTDDGNDNKNKGYFLTVTDYMKSEGIIFNVDILNLSEEDVIKYYNCVITINYPEKKLHPSKFTIILNNCLKLIENGTKIVIKTYSESILNQFRIAVKYNKLSHTDISLYHYTKNNTGKIPDNVLIYNGGMIENKPIGFFDQTTKDLKMIYLN